MKEILVYLSTIAQICLAINVILFVWRRKSLPTRIQILGYYILLNAFTELVATVLTKNSIENLWLLHIYTLLEFLAWSLFFKSLFPTGRKFQKGFQYFMVVISILIIANTVFLEPIHGFNSNAKSLVQIILISYVFYYFFRTFGKIDLSNSLHLSTSFINFAVLLYYSGSLFIFMFSRFLADQNVAVESQHSFWAINAVLLIIFQFLILLSLWIVAFPKTKSSQ